MCVCEREKERERGREKIDGHCSFDIENLTLPYLVISSFVPSSSGWEIQCFCFFLF